MYNFQIEVRHGPLKGIWHLNSGAVFWLRRDAQLCVAEGKALKRWTEKLNGTGTGKQPRRRKGDWFACRTVQDKQSIQEKSWEHISQEVEAAAERFPSECIQVQVKWLQWPCTTSHRKSPEARSGLD